MIMDVPAKFIVWSTKAAGLGPSVGQKQNFLQVSIWGNEAQSVLFVPPQQASLYEYLADIFCLYGL